AYALTRDLHLLRMGAEYLAGHTSEARASFDTARSRLESPKDRVAFYAAWIELETAHGNFAEALAAGRELLASLGAPLPARSSPRHGRAQYGAKRIAEARRAQRLRASGAPARSRFEAIEDLVNIEDVHDPKRDDTLRMLMALAPPAFFLDRSLFGWIMLRIAG